MEKQSSRRTLPASRCAIYPDIGYIHIADIPGRHEPGAGNLDWSEILKKIRQTGYSGDVGFEYAPRDDSTDSLNRILTLWNEICV